MNGWKGYMTNTKVPCKNCADRATACHDYCDKYKEYRKGREALAQSHVKESKKYWQKRKAQV